MPSPIPKQIRKALTTLGATEKVPVEQQRHQVLQRSVSEPPLKKYRWRKLKINYSDTVLAMYPYLADPDSDGYDDIAEGEEDDFVRWDPVNRVHVPRQVPLVSSRQGETDLRPIVTQLHTSEVGLRASLDADIRCATSENSPAQSFDGGQGGLDIVLEETLSTQSLPENLRNTETLLRAGMANSTTPRDAKSSHLHEDQVGLGALLDAVKAVSGNGPDHKNTSGGNLLDLSKHWRDDSVGDGVKAASLSVLTPQKPNPYPSSPRSIYIALAGNNSLSAENCYSLTPENKWDSLALSKEEGSQGGFQQKENVPCEPIPLSRLSGGSGSEARFELAVDDTFVASASLQRPSKYAGFKIPDITWSQGLTWSQVPTPQWELSPHTTPPHSPKPPKSDNFLLACSSQNYSPQSMSCESSPAPGCKGLQLPNEQKNGDLVKRQINLLESETQQKSKIHHESISLPQLFHHPDPRRTGAENFHGADLNLRKSRINPSVATVILRHDTSFGVTGSNLRSPEAGHYDRVNPILHSADDIITPAITDKNKVVTNRRICSQPVHYHPTRRYKSHYAHSYNQIKASPEIGLRKTAGTNLVHGYGRSEHQDNNLGINVNQESRKYNIHPDGSVVDSEKAERVDAKMDILCQRHGLPTWLRLQALIDAGLVLPEKKWIELNKGVAAMKPSDQSICRNEMVRAAFARGSKLPLPLIMFPAEEFMNPSTNIGESKTFDFSHGGEPVNDLASYSKPHARERRSSRRYRDSVEISDNEYSSHKHRDKSADNSPRLSKHHRDSSHKSHRDSTRTRRSSHKHHKHSTRSRSHESHRRHRHHRHHDESRSSSKAPKHSHRRHRSHEKSEDKRTRSRYEARSWSPDRGRHCVSDRKYTHGSRVAEDYDNVSVGRKRPRRSLSSSPARGSVSAHQKALESHSLRPQVAYNSKQVGEASDGSSGRTKERSPKHEHHRHRHHKSYHKRHSSRNSSTDSAGPKESYRSRPRSLAHQKKISSQLENTSIGVRQRLQEGYGDPSANFTTWNSEKGQYSLARYLGNTNHGGFRSAHHARIGINSRQMPRSETGNEIDISTREKFGAPE